MKDIDFDELDRAVSSLMNGTTPSNAPNTVSKPAPGPAATPPPASADGESIEVKTGGAPSAPSTVPVAAPAPVQRSGGRFMDLVPSSSRQLVTPPSREGIAITPRPSTNLTEKSPAPSPAAPPEPQAKTESNWPDPLDVTTPSVTQPSQSEKPALSAPTAGGPDSLESPFIADAKVEKRPLNATAAGATAYDQLAESLEAELSSAEPADSNPPSNSDEDNPPPVPPVPAELNSDLIAIESKEPAALAEGSPITTDSNDSEAVALKRLDEHSSGPSGPTSIVQQYKEKPSSGDQSHAAIYDTAAQFPVPLAHPAKKSSGWRWVLGVILLLALGAGTAFVLYSMGILT